MTHTADKWSEIEHLPQWDEEFYHVYTAKKFGKWVMLKTLKPQYRDIPEFREMIEKEFEVRYNLAHPHIVMINDYEEVPGLGMCIITDDVYGRSLRQIIDEGKITDRHVSQLHHQLVSAMEYILSNHIVHHPIRPETIIFTDKIENLKLIDVGYDQKRSLSTMTVDDDIRNYGLILREVIEKGHISDAHLCAVADRCLDPNPARRFHSVTDLHLALENTNNSRIYIFVISFMAIMIAALIALQISKIG